MPRADLVALAAAGSALSVFVATRAGGVEPWADDDPWQEPTRHEFGDYGLIAGAEYRANGLYLEPISLNDARNRQTSFVEQRLRLDFAVDYAETVTLVMSLDALSGTLWGDNGTFGSPPSPNSGSRYTASNPNFARPAVGYRGGDELDRGSYGWVLEPSEPIEFRRMYGEVDTPVGLLRIGRQPATFGMELLHASGDGRTNRFGYSNRGDSVDRALFEAKPLELFKPKQNRDRAPDRGLFIALFYDRLAGDELERSGDDLNGVGSRVRFLDPDPALRRDISLQGLIMHRWEREFDTALSFFGLEALARVDRLSIGGEGLFVVGRTREASEGLARINGDPIERQDVRQWGARAVARWDEPIWAAYLELDFASGDSDPNPSTPLTEFFWAEDNNVGLLMFERILAFESARSAASGVALLRTLGAPTFPAERVDTEGSFTNALAIFPQLDLHPIQNVLIRAGMLAAWAPSKLVDPVSSLRRRDGVLIDDDAVNYNGGRPGNFYGVELDGRLEWRYEEHFIFDLEGAILFPGDAFDDQNGQAVRSVLVQGRTTFAF